MKRFSLRILHIFDYPGRNLVHTLLQDGHNLIGIESPSLFNGRCKRADDSVVGSRGVSRHLAESFYIAINKGLCEFIVLDVASIGIRSNYIVAHPLGSLP